MVQGFVRFRKIQVGKQTVIGTVVPATRVLEERGLITLNPNRTDPDVEVGSLDPVLLPYTTTQEVTAGGVSGPLIFDDTPVNLSAALKGSVTATGNALSGFTWTYTCASLTADSFDYWSMQTGDDTADALGAGTNGFGGVIDSLSLEMNESLEPWSWSNDWVFAGATYGNRTGALTPDANPAYGFGADSAFYLDTVAGAIGTTQLIDSVRAATLTINNNLDQKRFANGSNTRFQLGAYGRGAREIELKLTVEKNAQTIAEANTIDDATPANRYIKISINSTQNAGTSTPYKLEWFLPSRLFSVEDGEIGGNTNYVLTYHGYYDPTLAYALKAVVLNKLSALP